MSTDPVGCGDRFLLRAGKSTLTYSVPFLNVYCLYIEKKGSFFFLCFLPLNHLLGPRAPTLLALPYAVSSAISAESRCLPVQGVALGRCDLRPWHSETFQCWFCSFGFESNEWPNE
jgi:hypothetical protein